MAMHLNEVIAREAIRDLVARYNATADSGLFDRTLELFAEDAVLEASGASHEGRDAIRQMFQQTKDSMGFYSGSTPAVLRHFTSTLQIDLLSLTTARSRCYLMAVLPGGVDHWGRYLDEFAVVDGEWRFTSRRVLLDGQTPRGWSATRHDSS